MTAIDITQLTDEQKKALQNQLKEEEKAKKEKKAQDLKALEDLAAGTVPTMFELLKSVSDDITKIKEVTFRTFENYLKLKIETMGIKAKNQQSHTITHGKQSIKLGYRITDGYTDEAGYGLEMVHKFLGTLVKDDRDYPDTDFQKGVEIIQNAYKPKLSKWFIEAWEVDGVGIERNLPLSMTSAELSKDIDLSFLLPQE